MKEIGSEYYYEEIGFEKKILCDEFQSVNNYAWVFSGRTAIETILKNSPRVKKVILPSYCCDSMIEPFRKANISIAFYDVFYDKKLVIDIEITEDVDMILWCNYFGFYVEMPDFTKFINRGGIVVEDITHSFLSERPFHKQSHYLVASIRKWGPILCGGYCAAISSSLHYIPTDNPSEEFLQSKLRAMRLKREYLYGKESIEKQMFLNDFNSSNKWLASNYSNLKMDDESIRMFNGINWDEVRERRKENAHVLYEGLEDNPNIKFLFPQKDMRCPLFVPIIIEKRKRNELREKLVNNNIYCPVHWPKPNEQCESNLYDFELSLICDQRYKTADMKKIVSIICGL